MQVNQSTAADAAPVARPYCFRAAPELETFALTRTLAEQGLLPEKVTPWIQIRLDFSQVRLADPQLRELAEFIEAQAAYLRDLALNLSGCCDAHAQSGLENIFNALGKAKYLEVLVIDLSRPAFTDDDGTLAALGKSVLGLPELGGCLLNLDGCNFSSEGIAGLFAHLSQARKLKVLFLNFSEAAHIDARALEDIENAVTPCQSLKKLSLDFSHIRGMDDTAAEYLGWMAARMAAAAEELNVNISGTECTAQSLENIARRARASAIQSLTLCAFDVAQIDRNCRGIIADFNDMHMKATLYTRPEDCN